MNNLYTWLIEIKIKLWTKTSKFWIEIFSWDWEIGIICWIWISNVTIQIYRHRPLTIKIWTGRGRDILASVMATVMLLLASLFLKSLWRMFLVWWKPLDITADSLNLNTWKLKNAWYTNDNRSETAVSFLVTRDLIDQSQVFRDPVIWVCRSRSTGPGYLTRSTSSWIWKLIMAHLLTDAPWLTWWGRRTCWCPRTGRRPPRPARHDPGTKLSGALRHNEVNLRQWETMRDNERL